MAKEKSLDQQVQDALDDSSNRIFARLVESGKIYDASRKANRELRTKESTALMKDAEKNYARVAKEFDAAKRLNPDWEKPDADVVRKQGGQGPDQPSKRDRVRSDSASGTQKSLEQSFWEGE